MQRLRVEGDVQEVGVAGDVWMCRSRSVGRGGILLKPLVFVLRPLKAPLNSQRGAVSPPLHRTE